ncbi:flagellar motor protein [Thermosediminibacter litoriperuensis]|uniref:Chemotaxis protein MotA n=1 Tax=Thermosediminibacter litoriperuensis TaxID=291989 RepID=A0A5S5B0M9_9FIRM|nr:flagellar motor protein [Thermosediminibacter litoriperuensis]TYP59922.1 chemotaxis protein MotA [Thermosediminibacter litoriperuensis]
MDRATIIGIIGGLAIFLWAIYMGGPISAFINIPSMLIVLGGVVASTLINYPLSKLIEVVKILKNVVIEKQMSSEEIIRTIVNLADTARREGLLALEDTAAQIQDDFMKRGIMLVVDGTDPELVKNILETELAFLEERHKEGQSIFETMGALAPAYGLIGTIIGLIQMLNKLDDPSAVGPGMAVALITTFYGATLANFLFLPIAGKLKVRSKQEILMKEVMIEGILSIQAGENPRIIEEKLKAFLAPKLRETLKERGTSPESGDSLAWR